MKMKQTPEAPVTVNVHQVRFDSEDVVDVAGVSAMTLQNWIARGWLVVQQKNPGRGKSREFTAYEVARIRFMKKLVAAAVPVGTAFKITSAFKNLWDAAPGVHELAGDEPTRTDWLLIIPAEEWTAGRRASVLRDQGRSFFAVDEFVAIWKMEFGDVKQVMSVRAFLDLLSGSPVLLLDAGKLLGETIELLKARVQVKLKGESTHA
jgi:MerR-like DNA binding protein